MQVWRLHYIKQETHQACDHLMKTHDMVVYWKKVQGHSRVPGQDKQLNDQTDALAKQGAIKATPWIFGPGSIPSDINGWLVPTLNLWSHAHSHWCPWCLQKSLLHCHALILTSCLISLQILYFVYLILHLSDPISHTLPDGDLDSIRDLRDLYIMRSVTNHAQVTKTSLKRTTSWNRSPFDHIWKEM